MKLPDGILRQHIAVLGKTGSGKSYCAKGIVERLARDGHQVCVLDPTAAWWGLRLGADGKSKGLHFVLIGGKHGDIPLAPQSGAAVARLVTQQHASVVCDLSGMTVGEYTRWFIDFAGVLYTTIRQPLHLVIDEAHYFMPQGGGAMDVERGKMLHAGNRLMSGGRSLGIRGMMITQRPAKLHKDALTCADTLIAMRVIAPQDRSAIKDWVDGAGDQSQGKAVLDSLAGLKRGEGWVWYPEGGYMERHTFPKIKTYDSSATPEHGAKNSPEVSQIDLDEVRTAMADAVAEAKANDPRELRKQVAELKAELSKLEKTKPTAKVETRTVEKAVFRKGEVEGLAKLCERAHELIQKLQAAAGSIERASMSASGQSEFTSITHPPAKLPEAFRASKTKPVVVSAPRRPTPPQVRHAGENGDVKLNRAAERRVLAALATKSGPATKRYLAMRSGYAINGGGFGGALSKLRKLGLITRGDPCELTDEGRAACAEVDPLPTGQALIDFWMSQMKRAAEREVLRVVIEAYPGSITKEEAAARAGYEVAGGGFGGALSKLRTLELISGRGELRASDELFE